MLEELKAIVKNQTLELTTLPEDNGKVESNRKIVIDKEKARLVAKWFLPRKRASLF